MEQTFMTIHILLKDLTPDANILYASESIVDILGYSPREVLGRSSFDYFHPQEVPFARSVHSRGVLLDKAAVLHYARIRSRDGRWISCECCFTIVHDVLVACTSIYRRGEKSERRAIEAPQIRRIFSCSPRDPRYHMLEHLSSKFKMSPTEREPRAALILNRFTRTLAVMFATEAISSVLGVSAEQVLHKSFYECIRESSLDDAFKCLESAKANDSIAYLRFWSRDPRRPEDFESEESEDEDTEASQGDDNDGDDDGEEYEEKRNDDYAVENDKNTRMSPMESATQDRGPQPLSGHQTRNRRRSSESEEGGVKLEGDMDIDSHQKPSPLIKTEPDTDMLNAESGLPQSTPISQTVSSAAFPSASDTTTGTHTPVSWGSSTTAAAVEPQPRRKCRRTRRRLAPSVELEAVVSCTSDGLVVILRRARPQIPSLHPPLVPFGFDNGLFAAPWGQQPIRPHYSPEVLYNFRPPLLPQYMPLRENVKAAGGPPLDQLMLSIRDVAVFAWALVGINGNMAAYSHGFPMDDAQPPEGLPIWDPSITHSSYLGPENQAALRAVNNDDGQKAPHRHAESFFAEPSRERPILNNSGVTGGHYSFDNGAQWPLQTESQGQLPHYPHHQPVIPELDAVDQLRPQQTRPFDRTSDLAPQSPNEWVESYHTPGNHQKPSEAREEPQNQSHIWYS
ncbi:hypothetical protein AK830_g10376 [Neonectria ditissima]|uniref:PAS domain-containing protein n=1 Tax=Neonectria ditissima TaxID=78410 RepID=A0A0P7AFY7_9HYPO|nr:hypothetical protein AK830_g10376 [Neonectria ditissima]